MKKKVFQYEGAYHNITGKIFDIMALSFLWLLCCIPIITIGASTTALYYTVHKVEKQDIGYLASQFFKAFKENLRPAVLLWMLLAILMFVFQLNIGIIYNKMDGNIAIFFLILYGILSLITFGIQLYAFPVLSRFDMPVGWILKASIYMTFRHLKCTVILLVSTGLAFFIVFYFWQSILVVPALMHYMYHYFLEEVLTEHMPAREALE